MNAAIASTKAAVVVLAVAAVVAGSPTARACGWHDDPSGYGVGMLNWAYPDALHVRTAVWSAQRDGLLARAEPLPAVDPASWRAQLERMTRLSEAQWRLETLRGALDTAVADSPAPAAFAVVLIGPMLWTRFEAADGGMRMTSHVPGPTPGDVVVVTDEAVVTALVDGRLAARDLHDRGLVRLYGGELAVAQVSALFDRLARVQEQRAADTPR